MTLQYPCQTLQPYAFITVSENRLLKLRNCADLVLHFFCAKNRWQYKKQCYNHPCVPLYTKAFLGISDCCVRVCGTHPGNILLCMLPKKTPRSNTGSFLFTQKKSPDALLLSLHAWRFFFWQTVIDTIANIDSLSFAVFFFYFLATSLRMAAMLQLSSPITSVRLASLFSIRTSRNQLSTTGKPKSLMKLNTSAVSM